MPIMKGCTSNEMFLELWLAMMCLVRTVQGVELYGIYGRFLPTFRFLSNSLQATYSTQSYLLLLLLLLEKQ